MVDGVDAVEVALAVVGGRRARCRIQLDLAAGDTHLAELPMGQVEMLATISRAESELEKGLEAELAPRCVRVSCDGALACPRGRCALRRTGPAAWDAGLFILTPAPARNASSPSSPPPPPSPPSPSPTPPSGVLLLLLLLLLPAALLLRRWQRPWWRSRASRAAAQPAGADAGADAQLIPPEDLLEDPSHPEWEAIFRAVYER